MYCVGDVILKIVDVDLSKWLEGVEEYMFFEVCFECGLDVICDVGDVVWWCFGGMICFV